jgi:hypothetical protein
LEKQIMIRNNKFLIAAGAAALSAGIYTSALSAATVTANASANVVQALVITENNGGIDFGDVSETGNGGTITYDTLTGTRNVTGDAVAQPSDIGQLGLYTISGEELKTYVISYPTTAVTLNGPGTATMTVDNWNDTADGTAAAAGEQFSLGARLNISPGQASGAYSGSYTITVNYN